jgi:hypothetical protein
VGPYFSNVENVKSVLFCILFWHRLHKPVPRREITLGYFIV